MGVVRRDHRRFMVAERLQGFAQTFSEHLAASDRRLKPSLVLDDVTGPASALCMPGLIFRTS